MNLIYLMFFSLSMGEGLATLSQKSQLELGSAFYYRAGWDTLQYQTQFLQNFNHLTPEGGIVWGEFGVSPSQGVLNFQGGDRIINFAHKNKLKVKAQHLVWARYLDGKDPLLPNWIINDQGEVSLGKDSLKYYLKDFISQTINHYQDKFPGTIKWWSVVNEAGSNLGDFEKNLWLDSLGSSYIDSAFVWAKNEVDEGVKLFYNEYFYHGVDYGATRIPSKINHAYKTVAALLDNNIPIDAMGFQTHISTLDYPGKETIAADMKRFSDLGIEVYITELDVSIPEPVTPAKLQQQADIYQDITEIALENPHIKLLCLWQFNDAQSWFPQSRAPTIMDSLYQPKKAYHAMVKVLQENQTTSIKKTISGSTSLGFSTHLGQRKDISIHKIDGTLVNLIRGFTEDYLTIQHLARGRYFVIVRTPTSQTKFSFILE